MTSDLIKAFVHHSWNKSANVPSILPPDKMKETINHSCLYGEDEKQTFKRCDMCLKWNTFNSLSHKFDKLKLWKCNNKQHETGAAFIIPSTNIQRNMFSRNLENVTSGAEITLAFSVQKLQIYNFMFPKWFQHDKGCTRICTLIVVTYRNIDPISQMSIKPSNTPGRCLTMCMTYHISIYISVFILDKGPFTDTD